MVRGGSKTKVQILQNLKESQLNDRGEFPNFPPKMTPLLLVPELKDEKSTSTDNERKSRFTELGEI